MNEPLTDERLRDILDYIQVSWLKESRSMARELLAARKRIAELEAENAQQKETLRLIVQALKQRGSIGLAVWEMA